MNTAEALEQITNRGKFEVLAARILRIANKNYEAIIEDGTNAAGETIASPVDGFCKVPESDPPHFVYVQHTTDDRKKLKGKWLSDKLGEQGDLVKACEEVENYRKIFPNAKFTLILSTNQRLPSEKKSSLRKDIYSYAELHKVDLDLWEQSRYAAFLDTQQIGQWLRKEYLGITAEILSLELLRYIGNKSLELYKTKQSSMSKDWIKRELEEPLLLADQQGFYESYEKKRVQPIQNQRSIIFLVGESGFGKSVFANQFLEEHLRKGNLGIFIPEELLETSISIEDVLDQSFQRYYPGLLQRENQRAKDLIPLGSQFVIIVDDINRANEPMRMAQKLINWAVPPYLIICPLWKQSWELLSTSYNGAKRGGTFSISIGKMTFEESSRVLDSALKLTNITFTKFQIEELVIKLGRDPFLLGSFCELLMAEKDKDFFALAENALENYIVYILRDNESSSNFIYFELRKALWDLCVLMLKEHSLTPTWVEIQRWFETSPETINALKHLSKDARICRISTDNTFSFRHDRFLEYFLIESISKLMKEDPIGYSDILFDPYYYNLVGQALVTVNGNLPLPLISQIAEKLPLAIAIAVKHIGKPLSEPHQTIVKIFKNWVSSYGRQAYEIVSNAILRILANTDSPVILELNYKVFSGRFNYWMKDVAKFRNGDIDSGIQIYMRVGNNIQSSRNLLPILEHVKIYHQRHLLDEIKSRLRSTKGKELKAVLLLCSSLGVYDELNDELINSWNQISEKKNYIAEFLWAFLQCSSEDKLSLGLEPVLSLWEIEPDKKYITENLRQAFQEEVPNYIIEYLIKKANSSDALREPLAYLCGMIDSPVALEFAIHTISGEDNIEAKGGFTKTEELIYRWEYREFKEGESFGRKLSLLTVKKLHNIWDNPENRASVRKLSFSIWLNNAKYYEENILQYLKVISADSPCFEQSVWTRCYMNDLSVIPDLIPLLSNDFHWFRIAGFVWSDSLISIIEPMIQVLCRNISNEYYSTVPNEHYYLYDFLTVIPPSVASGLINEHWQFLKFSPIFIQAALFIGTDLCKSLVNEVVPEYPEDIDIFEFIDQHWGFEAFSHSRKLTLQHFVSLEPYLYRFSKGDLLFLAKGCRQFGPEGVRWGQKHLYELLDNQERKSYFPSDKDLSDALNNISDVSYISSWLDDFRDRHDTRNPIDIVKKWFEENPSIDRLRVTTEIIKLVGTRADLKILDAYKIEKSGNSEKFYVDRILEETKYIVFSHSLQ